MEQRYEDVHSSLAIVFVYVLFVLFGSGFQTFSGFYAFLRRGIRDNRTNDPSIHGGNREKGGGHATAEWYSIRFSNKSLSFSMNYRGQGRNSIHHSRIKL